MGLHRIYIASLLAFLPGGYFQGTYKAAIVEYNSPYSKTTTEFGNMQNQVKRYISLIEDASRQGANIIVFPEAGITSLQIRDRNPEHLKAHSVAISDEPNFYPNVTGTSPILRNLSQAAEKNNIYLVVNLLEKVDKDSKSMIYNTDVVFNKQGQIIAKYRRMNTENESIITPGDKVVTFTTTFGVTFGLLIGSDILYEKPIMDLIANRNVTDFILTSAWSSNLPFLQALSVQSGLSRAYGVNVLASVLNDYTEKTSGSGIYLANGTTYVFVQNNKNETKLIVENVNKINERSSECISNNKIRQYVIDDTSSTLNSYRYTYENLSQYKHKSIEIREVKGEIKEEVCDGDFCCKFEIKLASNSQSIYKIIAFKGTSEMYNSTTEIGKQSCALVACQNSSIESCGMKVDSSHAMFDSIRLTTSTKNCKKNYFIPITLTEYFVPLDNYYYCVQDDCTINMETKAPISGLNTFGIYGRDFTMDNKPSNSPSSSIPSIYLVAIVTCFFTMRWV